MLTPLLVHRQSVLHVAVRPLLSLQFCNKIQRVVVERLFFCFPKPSRNKDPAAVKGIDTIKFLVNKCKIVLISEHLACVGALVAIKKIAQEFIISFSLCHLVGIVEEVMDYRTYCFASAKPSAKT